MGVNDGEGPRMITQDYGEGEIGFPPLLAAFLPMITSAFKGGGASPTGGGGGGADISSVLSTISSVLRPAAPPIAVAPAPQYMPAPQYYPPQGGAPGGCAPGTFRSARFNICWSPSTYPNEEAAFRAFQAQGGGGAGGMMEYDEEGMPIHPGAQGAHPGYPQADAGRGRGRGHGRRGGSRRARGRGRHMRGFDGLGEMGFAIGNLSPGWSTALVVGGGLLAAAGAFYGFRHARGR